MSPKRVDNILFPKQVLTRIISIVKRLATNILAFQVDFEQLYVENNELFLQMIEMVAEFDPIMKEHIRRTQAREIQYTYLGPKIQNELIQILAGEVRNAIVTKVKRAKYFSVILDCTPDANYEEQMSLVLRCVDDSIDSLMVQEYWIEFFKVDDVSGLGLLTELKNVLKNLELDIDNIRGQGYENGANMSGRHRGVQKRLLEINPRAFYTPCGCHSLNLALCDMANCCSKAISFFGVIQRIYTVFSSSPKRWKILKDNVEGLTLKPLSQTRWESHVESVKPIKEQSVRIRDALLDLANIDEDPKTKSQAESLAIYELENFEFLLGIVIWYKLLHAVNTVSNFFQAENMDIDEAIKLLEALILFLENYRESGFTSAMDEAKQMANEMGIEAVFREKRNIRRKMQFDESGSEEVTQSVEESFRVDYFLFIIDQTRSSLQTHFEQFKHYEDTFGFLSNLERLKSMHVDSLLKSCNNLEQYLTHNGHSDIIGNDLCTELTILKCNLPRETKRAIDVLNYLKKMNGCFPNTCIAYKILLTIPITVASAERSFSKLKLIKTYIRSTMSQQRLNGLAMLSIEKEMVEQLDYTKLIDIFLSKIAGQTVVLKVGMSCQGCVGAVKRVLGKMEGVESFDIDIEQQKVTVKGNVQPEAVLQTVSKTGKATSFWEAVEAPAAPESKSAETLAALESKPTETPTEPESKHAEAPAEPESKPAETPIEPGSKRAEAPAEPESNSTEASEPESKHAEAVGVA